MNPHAEDGRGSSVAERKAVARASDGVTKYLSSRGIARVLHVLVHVGRELRIGGPCSPPGTRRVTIPATPSPNISTHNRGCSVPYSVGASFTNFLANITVDGDQSGIATTRRNSIVDYLKDG